MRWRLLLRVRLAMVPRHLAPIIAKLINHDHLKVSKKTIVLERENIKDNYRAYN